MTSSLLIFALLSFFFNLFSCAPVTPHSRERIELKIKELARTGEGFVHLNDDEKLVMARRALDDEPRELEVPTAEWQLQNFLLYSRDSVLTVTEPELPDNYTSDSDSLAHEDRESIFESFNNLSRSLDALEASMAENLRLASEQTATLDRIDTTAEEVQVRTEALAQHSREALINGLLVWATLAGAIYLLNRRPP